MYKKSIILLLVSLSCVVADTSFRQRCDTLRDAVYMNDSIETVRMLYKAACDSINFQIEDKKSRAYWLCRAEYLIGRGEQHGENWQKAEIHYEDALKLINEFMNNNEHSEGYRMKSEIIGQLCLVKVHLKKVFYVFANGRKVKALANKAIDLNPKNGKAFILLASSDIYSPKIYGGNPEQGVIMMKKAHTMPDIEKDDLFNINLGLGIAYGKMGENKKAKEFFKKALELYPGNRFCNKQYEKVCTEI